MHSGRAERAQKKFFVESRGLVRATPLRVPPGNIFNFNSGNESPDRARQFGIVFVVVDIRLKPHTLPLLSA